MLRFNFGLLLAAVLTVVTAVVAALPADPGPCCFS